MNINILGYGLMGKQIAALFYLGGFDVNIWSNKNIDTKDIFRQIKLLKRTITVSEIEGNIVTYTDLEKLPDAITIETVIEDLEIKKYLYCKFKSNNYPFFTNSSSFAPYEIGETVNAIHFFNPISLKLVELFLYKKEIQNFIQPFLNFLSELNFEIVTVNSNRGYIGNYILFNEISSALKLVEKFKYSYENINQVYKKLYNGRDLFLIIDLIGIDVVYKILNNLKEEDETIYVPTSLTLALNKGIYGKKNKTSIIEILSEIK